jgi:hypothetical protein
MTDISLCIEGLLLHPHQRDRSRLPTLNLSQGGDRKNQDVWPKLIVQHENIVTCHRVFEKGETTAPHFEREHGG